MLLDLRRFILTRWTSFMIHLSTLWGLFFLDRVQYDRPTNGPIGPRNQGVANAQNRRALRDNFPPTEEQLEERIAEFIDSINEDAVCRLASQYNRQRPCSIIGRDRGSFNVCFFVRFNGDGVTWVVRIPLEPVVHSVWDKVQSEVTTMRFIERNTTIPISHVHAYGEGAELLKDDSTTTQAFLICDYVSGQPLNMRMLANATKDQREQFYDDLINILAQLRKLEFPTVGSLMPNPDNESEPIVGGPLSMATNELQRCQEHRRVGNFTSGEQYGAYQCHILSETYRLPTEDLSCKQVQMELFALDSLANDIPKLIDSQWLNGPFVLAHQDLRCGNIIVTEDLRIHGIIDWEFTGTVPRTLFTPPPWITGHDLAAVAAIPSCEIYPEFIEVLEAKSITSGDCAKLRDDWKYLPDLTFPIAQIFRHPSSLIRVYYKFIFPRLFKGDHAIVVPKFFERPDIAQTLAVEVRRRIEESRRYTQYLKDRGLFVVDQQSQANQEWLAKVKQLRKT